MNWLFSTLKQEEPLIREPQIDCDSCKVRPPLVRMEIYQPDTKCCEFSPLWSGFGVGAWLKRGHRLNQLSGWEKGGWEITVLGLLHDREHRLQKKSLCHFFSKTEKKCEIWENRPPTCYSFFCSSRHKDGIKVYGDLEKWLLKTEAQLLQVWFDSQINNSILWQQWCELMDEKPVNFDLPVELRLGSIEEAEKHYIKMFDFLNSEGLMDFRERQSSSWELGLSRHPHLC